MDGWVGGYWEVMSKITCMYHWFMSYQGLSVCTIVDDDVLREIRFVKKVGRKA